MEPPSETGPKKEEDERDQAEIEKDNERARRLTEGFKRITKELESMPF